MKISNKMKLESAAKPYIEQGYIIVSETNQMMRLLLAKDQKLKHALIAISNPKMAHVIRNTEKSKTVTIRINSASEIEIMGHTLEKKQKEAQKTIIILLVLVGLFLLFLCLCFVA